MIRIY